MKYSQSSLVYAVNHLLDKIAIKEIPENILLQYDILRMATNKDLKHPSNKDKKCYKICKKALQELVSQRCISYGSKKYPTNESITDDYITFLQVSGYNSKILKFVRNNIKKLNKINGIVPRHLTTTLNLITNGYYDPSLTGGNKTDVDVMFKIVKLYKKYYS